MDNPNVDRQPNLALLGSETFCLSGDLHRLVTFLNRSLKRQGLVFGFAKSEEGMRFSIYQGRPDQGTATDEV